MPYRRTHLPRTLAEVRVSTGGHVHGALKVPPSHGRMQYQRTHLPGPPLLEDDWPRCSEGERGGGRRVAGERARAAGELLRSFLRFDDDMEVLE